MSFKIYTAEEFMISFTPDTIEDLAYEYSDKLNLKGWEMY